MNIRLAYDFDLKSFQSLFPEVEVFDWEKDKNEEIDLLIFPGGADVQLDWYMENDKELRDHFNKICYFDKERDEYEKEIFDAMMTETIKVKKVLGVCRGLQFINTMFSGYLYADLPTYNIYHGQFHNLTHITQSNLNFIRLVNSYHHQGVKISGKFYKLLNKETNPKTIATDIWGNVKEIITWLDGKILGVQYHPEYYAECQDKRRFRNFILSWISGDTKIFKEEEL